MLRRARPALIALPMLVGALLSAPARAGLPERISVNTPTQALTASRLYAVEEGRVYVRSAVDPLAKWQLLGEKGGPRVTSISADDEMLAAVTDDGAVHRFVNGAWHREWGLPAPGGLLQGPLHMPKSIRSWAYSERHKNVLYYEDPYGNQFHWGSAGCTTLFVLAGDGKRIRMGDPWFPPELSRQLCGPERGRVESVAIAASASTVMLLAADGRVFTTFYDYDVNGGTPFFRYRYFDVPRHGKPGSDRTSEFETRGLPLEDWVEQPRIVLEGEASLARSIAVLQNGTGNFARELRVAGTSSDGRRGYYTKQLEDRSWRFVETGEDIPASSLLVLPPSGLEATVTSNRDRAMSGVVFVPASARGGPSRLLARVETEDFNLHCSPVRLKVTMTTGLEFEVDLHLVDAWQIFTDPDADEDPTAFNKLKGTIEIPKELLESPKPALRQALARTFLPFHRKSFSLAVIAGQSEVLMLPVGYPAQPSGPKLEVRLRPRSQSGVDAPARVLPVYSREVAPTAFRPEESLQESKAALAKDLASLRKVRAMREQLEARVSNTRWMKALTPAGTFFLDALSVLSTTRFTVKQTYWLPGLEEHLPALLTTAHEAARLRLKRAEPDFQFVQTALRTAICQRARRLRGEAHEELDPQTRSVCRRMGLH